MNALQQARKIGWLSVGSGLALIVAPRTAARGYGMALHNRALLRVLGARDVVIGTGILAGKPSRWMKLRVASELVDLSLIAANVVTGPQRPVGRLLVGIAAAVALVELTRRL